MSVKNVGKEHCCSPLDKNFQQELFINKTCYIFALPLREVCKGF